MTDINDRSGFGQAIPRAEPRRGEGGEVGAIRADIMETRERMGDTVEQIGHRLNPDRLKQQVRDNLHDATIGKAEHMARRAAHRVDDTRTSLLSHVRENPIPAAMVGVGLGWLLVNARRGDEEMVETRGWREAYGRYDEYYAHPDGGEGYEEGGRGRVAEVGHAAKERGEALADRTRDRATEIASEARDVVSSATDRTRGKLNQATNRARDVASDIARETRYRSHRVEDRFEETLRESPLAMGAAAVALGMAVGLTTPTTRRESEMIGGVRDRVVDRAKDAISSTTDKVRDMAERVGESSESAMSGSGRPSDLP